MAISPFNVRRASPEGESRRARLAIAIAIVGIAATLLAYALSPGVRHAVGHAAHSVKHAVSHVFDPDHVAGTHARHRLHLVQPLRPAHAGRLRHHTNTTGGSSVPGAPTSTTTHAPASGGG